MVDFSMDLYEGYFIWCSLVIKGLPCLLESRSKKLSPMGSFLLEEDTIETLKNMAKNFNACIEFSYDNSLYCPYGTRRSIGWLRSEDGRLDTELGQDGCLFSKTIQTIC